MPTSRYSWFKWEVFFNDNRARNSISATFLLLALLPLLGMVSQANAQDTLRIATYNLLGYPTVDDTTVRNPHFRKVMKALDADLLVAQEVMNQSGCDGFRTNVLNAGQPGAYAAAAFHDGWDTDNGFFYKTSKVAYIGAAYLSPGANSRDIAEYRFKLNGRSDTLRIFSLHIKAGNTSGDSLQRYNEATFLRSYLNTLPVGSRFIVAGDFNIYRSAEGAFQKLIGSEANNNGRCKDPLNSVGVWHNNSAFRTIHTQSPRLRQFAGGATGGMDDRFDMLLVSDSILQHLITPSYTAFGNDGNHFNDSINRLPNTAVSDIVANGLHYASDHLPVVAAFLFGGGNEVRSYQVSVGWNLVSVPLAVANYARSAIFPTAVSAAFAFGGGTGTPGYVQRDTLRIGEGYWVKFGVNETVSILGVPIARDTVTVTTGWNLIGTISDSLPTMSIQQNPPGLIVSPFYGYNGSYVRADTLVPGRSYWVKTASAGTLVLAGAGQPYQSSHDGTDR